MIGSDGAELLFAAGTGDIETVKTLLAKGVDVNALDEYGGTALMLAAHKGRYEVVRMLLDKGADINARNGEGKTALTLALTSPDSNRRTIDILREAEKPNTVDFAGIRDLINNGNVSELKRQIEKGFSVLNTDNDKNSLLHIAAEIGDMEIVKYLIDKGVQLDHCNNSNHTALYRAATAGYLQVVKYLCEHGSTTHGPALMSPLAVAVSSGHLEIVKYFVEQMNVPLNSLVRPFNATPLYIAASFLKLDIARYLMGRGGNPNIPNKDGETAIGRVQKIKHDMDHRKISPNEAQLINDLLACLLGTEIKSTVIPEQQGGAQSEGLSKPMGCYNHPGVKVSGICRYCGRELCQECLKYSEEGKYYSCKKESECLAYQGKDGGRGRS